MTCRIALVAAGLALAGAGCQAARHAADHAALAPPPKTYEQLVAANYRILTPKETARLLGFAGSVSSCIRSRGIAVGHPQPQATKIVMTVPSGIGGGRLARLSFACGDRLGGPPPGASLVLTPDRKRLELYLPKRCLLDRKALARARGQ